jgi:hypothetical protein
MAKQEVATKENTEVSTELTDEELQMLREMSGHGDDNGAGLPRLSINHNPEWVDDDDQEADPITLPRGHYKITIDVEGDRVDVFAKEAVFHPMIHSIQYNAYDNQDGYVLTSQLFSAGKWATVILDSRGMESQAKNYKRKAVVEHEDIAEKIKCNNVMFGAVTMKAKDMHGKSYDIEDLPCRWNAKGASYMAVSDLADLVTKNKTPLASKKWLLKSLRAKSGDNTYFYVDPSVIKGTIKMSREILELSTAFRDTIAAENEYILSKYKAVHKPQADDDIAADFVGDIDLSADLNDDLSDVGA